MDSFVEAMKVVSKLMKFIGETVDVDVNFGFKDRFFGVDSYIYENLVKRFRLDELDTFVVCRATSFTYAHIEAFQERCEFWFCHPIFDCGHTLTLEQVHVTRAGRKVTVAFDWKS